MTTAPHLDVHSDLDDHALVAVDRRGQHCACGVIAEHREHLAALVLEALDAPPALPEESNYGSGMTYHVSRTEDLAIRHLLINPDIAACRTLIRNAPRSHQAGVRRRLYAVGLGYLHDHADALERRAAARQARHSTTAAALAEGAAAS